MPYGAITRQEAERISLEVFPEEEGTAVARGRAIQRMRLAAGARQADVARAVGVSVPCVSGWESGAYRASDSAMEEIRAFFGSRTIGVSEA